MSILATLTALVFVALGTLLVVIFLSISRPDDDFGLWS